MRESLSIYSLRGASLRPVIVKGVIMAANEWARRYGDQGIVSTSLHPGIFWFLPPMTYN